MGAPSTGGLPATGVHHILPAPQLMRLIMGGSVPGTAPLWALSTVGLIVGRRCGWEEAPGLLLAVGLAVGRRLLLRWIMSAVGLAAVFFLTTPAVSPAADEACSSSHITGAAPTASPIADICCGTRSCHRSWHLLWDSQDYDPGLPLQLCLRHCGIWCMVPHWRLLPCMCCLAGGTIVWIAHWILLYRNLFV